MEKDYYILNTILLVSGVIGGVLATIWGVYLGWKKVTGRDEEKLDKVRQELVTNLEKSRDEWKLKYESEHAEHRKDKDYWHNKSTEDQAILSKANEENHELKAKTNVIPILEAIKQVTEGMKIVSEIMQKTSLVMERLEKKLDLAEQKS